MILLTVLAIASFVTYWHDEPDKRDVSEFYAGIVMLVMVALGVSLRFVQETHADNAAAKLKAMIKVTATVVRDGQPKEIPLQQLVPGDVVKLSAGDMIPGDVRLLSAKDLFIIQATLTGESLPVEKTDARDPRTNVSSIEHTNICFLGTSVESGCGHGGHRRHRRADLLWQNGQQPGRPAGRDGLRPGRKEIRLADDFFHAGDGADGVPHQRPHQAQLGRKRSFSRWRWPSASRRKCCR